MSAAKRHHRAPTHRHVRQPLMGLAVAAALLPMVGVSTAQAASVLPDGPLTVRTISPIPGDYISNTLHGAVCAAPNTCTPVPYVSFLTPAGVAALDAAIGEHPDKRTVVLAYSNGAQIAQHWMDRHATDPGAPAAENLTFILMGNSTRAHGGIDSKIGVSQPSQYHVIDVAREYDPVADFPDHPMNLLALANALAGAMTVHDYRDVDINDPANIVWTEGNITYVLVPTENLPLLNPLRRVGLTALADQLNGPLKTIVDKGYDRSYIPADAQPAAASTPAVPPKEAAPTVADHKTVTSVAAEVPTAKRDSSPVEPEPVNKTDRTRASAEPDTSAPKHDVADTVKTMTRAATQQLKRVTEPLRPLRKPRETRTGDRSADGPSTDRSTSDSES